MNIDGGGWTRIYYNTTTTENYNRFRNCKNNGYFFETNFECINPNKFTSIKFTRNGYLDITTISGNITWLDIGGCYITGISCYTGWAYNVGSSRYTMRDYNYSLFGYNTGRWGTYHNKFQNEIIIYGK